MFCIPLFALKSVVNVCIVDQLKKGLTLKLLMFYLLRSCAKVMSSSTLTLNFCSVNFVQRSFFSKILVKVITLVTFVVFPVRNN